MGFRKKTKSKGKCGGGTPSISAIDLFCGVGGLTYGLQRSGVDVRLGVDIDPKCEYPYVANNEAEFLLRSVEELKSTELKHAFKEGSIKLLAGCAPCQTFSRYNRTADSRDNRWWLLKQFSRLVQELKPDLVTMENVPGLIHQKVFQDFVKTLTKSGFYVSYQIVNCVDYGIPQHRNRLVLLASKLGEIEILEPENFTGKSPTVSHAIKKLPPLEAGESDSRDPLHRSSTLSKLNLRRIKASRPGGTWRDWRKNLVANCHKKETGKTYLGVYGRMSWDEPAPTITTQFYGFGNGRFGHPEQDRAISIREGAILQSFPKSYKFVAPGEEVIVRDLGRLIGNAVPVKLGEVIGKTFIEHLKVHS